VPGEDAVVAIAERHDKTRAQVVLRSQVKIPGSFDVRLGCTHLGTDVGVMKANIGFTDRH
jgi:hypothetical protein